MAVVVDEAVKRQDRETTGSEPDAFGTQRMPGGINVLARGVSQRFGRTTVLEDINLTIGTGVFGLLGRNGAGKTTLLRTLATVLSPASGTLRLFGFDPTDGGERRALRRRLGYLPQQLGYYPNFTVAEFVEYFALLKEVPVRDVNQAVATAIRQVDLEDRARAKLKTLSGGMLRRVGIAQAIVNEPDLLLLDEPTTGLDPEQRVSFRALLREIGASRTVIVSTHLVEDIGAACSEVAVMDKGRIVFHGSPAHLVAQDDGAAAGDSALERGYTRILKGTQR